MAEEDAEVIIEEEENLPPLPESSWNDDTENLLKGWSDESKKCSRSHRFKRKVCKYLHMIILIITMISSYIFGSSGIIIIQKEDDNISAIQSYVLLIMGLLITFLKVAQLEKRAEKHKKFAREYGNFCKKIELQLALPILFRKPFLPFVSKVQRDHQKLIKSI